MNAILFIVVVIAYSSASSLLKRMKERKKKLFIFEIYTREFIIRPPPPPPPPPSSSLFVVIAVKNNYWIFGVLYAIWTHIVVISTPHRVCNNYHHLFQIQYNFKYVIILIAILISSFLHSFIQNKTVKWNKNPFKMESTLCKEMQCDAIAIAMQFKWALKIL